jgi:sigma-E factor negative regulatory protein RseB
MGKMAMKRRFALCETLLLGLFFVAVNASAVEQRTSLDWLKIVVSATHKTDYSGVFVYQHDNRVETSRITHVVGPGSEYEKLESLDGPKSLIIRHDGQVWCYINHKMEQVDSRQGRNRFPSLLPEQLSTLNANYRFKEAGVERVAERNAQVILFQPKDNLRYTHKIWVDTDSGLLMKAAVLGEKNRLVEQYAFTQLQIGGKIDRAWIDAIDSNATSGVPHLVQDAPADLHGAVSAHQEEPNGDTPVASGWMVDALPAGFKKTMELQRHMRGKHAPVTQLVFSDGMSAISVFIEPADGDQDDEEGLSSRGAVNLYHKVVDKNLYTVVGEVPPHTVMQVLDSVRHSGK